MEKLSGGAGAGVPRGRDGGDQRPRGRCGRASRASGPLDARVSPRGAPRGLTRASRGPDALDARPHRPRGRWSPPSRPRGTPAPAPPESFSKNVLASPSEFPYSTSSHGGVAQLGERLTGSQEVRGSIPLVSTIVNVKAFGIPKAFFHAKTLRATNPTYANKKLHNLFPMSVHSLLD